MTIPAMKLHQTILELLAEIDAYRARTGINETNFGLAALNDGKFVRDLRNGRVPSLTTIDKVRSLMRDAERSAA